MTSNRRISGVMWLLLLLCLPALAPGPVLAHGAHDPGGHAKPAWSDRAIVAPPARHDHGDAGHLAAASCVTFCACCVPPEPGWRAATPVGGPPSRPPRDDRRAGTVLPVDCRPPIGA